MTSQPINNQTVLFRGWVARLSRTKSGQRYAEGRSGFSIFELLIVITVLFIIAAMAAPQMMSMIRESRVFKAADQLREAMGEARRFAIDTGIDYEFRYELNGPTVVILPSELESIVDEATGTSTTNEEYIRYAIELPEDLRISAAEGVQETSERLDSQVFGSLGGSQLAQKSWSAPILFRFDGTSEDVEIRISSDDGLTSKVSVRGLTGSARTGQVYQEED